MGNLFFILKALILTVVLIFCMQIQINNRTIENHLEGFIKESSILSPIREVSNSGFIAIKATLDEFGKKLRTEASNGIWKGQSIGKRKLLEAKRSLAFEKEQQKKSEEDQREEGREDLQ